MKKEDMLKVLDEIEDWAMSETAKDLGKKKKKKGEDDDEDEMLEDLAKQPGLTIVIGG